MLGVRTGPLAAGWCPSDARAPSSAADGEAAAAAVEALALLDAEAAGGGALSGAALALVRRALRRQLTPPR
jgi:hypothetical protein